MPLTGTLEETVATSGTVVELIIKGDAQVAEHVFAAGRSKALRYMRKVHRISIHFVHDVLSMPNHEYEHVPSALNCSDIFTKPLGEKSVCYLRHNLMGW